MRWYQIGRWLPTLGLILFIPVFRSTVFEKVMILGIALVWSSWPWVLRKLRTRFWTCDESLSLTDAEPCEDRVGLILAGWVTNGVLVRFDVIQYEHEVVLSPVVFKSNMRGKRQYFAIPVDVPGYRGIDVILRSSTLNGTVIWHSDTELSIDRESLDAEYNVQTYKDKRITEPGKISQGLKKVRAWLASLGIVRGLVGWFCSAYNRFSDWSDRFAERTRMWHKWSGFTRKLSVRYRAVVRVVTVPKFENHRTFRLKEVWNPAWRNQYESYLGSKFLGLWVLGSLIGLILLAWELYSVLSLGRLEAVWALFM